MAISLGAVTENENCRQYKITNLTATEREKFGVRTFDKKKLISTKILRTKDLQNLSEQNVSFNPHMFSPNKPLTIFNVSCQDRKYRSTVAI